MFERLSSIFEPSSVKKERINRIMDDLRQVGPQKPLGYLPINTLIKICQISPESVEKELHKKGLKTLRLEEEEEETNVVGGALYAYDENSLQELLTNHQELLTKEGWPVESESFIRNLVVHAPQKTDLFNLIADAFNDQTNPGRK